MDASTGRTTAAQDRRDLLHKVVATHPHELADVVATLSGSVRSANELLEHLQRSADLAVRVVTGAASAGVTTVTKAGPTTAAHSGPPTPHIDAHQHTAGAGPTSHALATGQLVTADTTTATSHEQWPELTAAAHADGITSVLAAPLGPSTSDTGTDEGSVSVAVLNLYSSGPDGFRFDDIALTLVIADHLTRAIGDYIRLHDAQDLADGLTFALKRRAVIDQAKGILMAAHHIDADTAFELIRTESQNSNRKTYDLCLDFLDQHTGSGPGS